MGEPKEHGNQADFVVVANRLPVDLERTTDGERRWTASPGGLVSALEPFLRSRKGAWVGWPGVPDVDVEEFDDDGLVLHPVSLSADEVRDYYEGFSNATLWPLYHDVVERPVFDRVWWNSYVKVNRRFAQASADVAAPGATVWIQDYQLQLVPAMLRELRPDLRIGFFLHIPFPPVELFMQMPWRAAIIRGLTGADLVGFHRPGGAQNFLWLCRQLIGLESTRGAVGVRSRPGTMQVGDRTVRVGAFPISIDAAGLDTLARTKGVQERAAQLRRDLGNPKTVILGVDRLDYTKGIDLRLQALHELLHEGRLQPDDVTFVQLATPSRERVEHYQRMRGEIEQMVGRINGEFARVGHPVVHYLHQSVDRTELAAFFSAADVMVVTPLRDGMNLVCKEYVAARHDLGGALVLSEFAGAAAELSSAFLVNPHDLDGVKDALVAAITLDPAEGRRRMRAMRRQVLTHDVDRWARSFLQALGAEAVD
ncbi:trehalose-6-phosphate synthase [Amycolatopsis sp. SID8362]|uniref:alpha,alpha-trehalose-phosphate synthase (UDP-forming) n=1 Tax=Amycolatopsis sp. SID8362 TaxID=2690346 RepID=UPI00136D4DBB|nr:trehalose-6-phosphate synthase [Amycolatopsis sp. SID8362]NBH03535.1 trehalose-6-phosphate synthase [Amycolatopsis sp. SID8362]NED40236.1 trehalose-6-phosphate synthase [Amycolatopsis sp. SID8362]